VFENRVLMKISGAKTDDLTGEQRRLHNEELYDLYYPQNNIRVIKPGTIRGMRHVQDTGEVHKRFWSGNLMERDHLKVLRVDERIILKLIFKK
jgi:hypothetical protein